jgi:anti-sigma B factor antagonist
MPDVSYNVRMIGGMPVVATPEEIDVSSAYALGQELVASANRGHAVVAVDMTRTQFCDSVGLNVLIRAHQRAEAAGGGLRLVVQAPAILRVLAVTGTDQIIPHFTNLDDALAEPLASPLPPRPGHIAHLDLAGALQRPYPERHEGLQASCDA